MFKDSFQQKDRFSIAYTQICRLKVPIKRGPCVIYKTQINFSQQICTFENTYIENNNKTRLIHISTCSKQADINRCDTAAACSYRFCKGNEFKGFCCVLFEVIIIIIIIHSLRFCFELTWNIVWPDISSLFGLKPEIIGIQLPLRFSVSVSVHLEVLKFFLLFLLKFFVVFVVVI